MSFYLGGLAFTLPPISMTFATSAVYADDGKGRNVDLGPACTAVGWTKEKKRSREMLNNTFLKNLLKPLLVLGERDTAMTHKLVLVSASVFAMSGLVPVAHATSLDDVCNLPDPIENDTKVDQVGYFSGNCTITVDNAVLEIDGVSIVVNGELKFVDVPEDEGAAALVIKNAQITTADRLEVEGAWNGGVTLENNNIYTAEDLRVKPTGGRDLMFTNNGGAVAGDIRLGDAGLQGDIVARNNAMNVAGDFRAETTDGDITVRDNGIENSVSNVQIVSASGDIGVKNNVFPNTATAQGITVTSEVGDVRVRLNTFGVSVGAVSIESTTGPCESNRNGPVVVDQEACQS